MKKVCSLVNVYTHCCLKAEPIVESDQHKLLMQIEALVLQKSFLAVQAMACLAEVGTALFTVQNPVSASWCTQKPQLPSWKEIFLHRKGNKEEEAIFYQLLIGKNPLHLSNKEQEHNAEQSCSEVDRWDKDTGSDDVGLGSLDHFSSLPQVGWWLSCSLHEPSSIRKGKGNEVHRWTTHWQNVCVCQKEG